MRDTSTSARRQAVALVICEGVCLMTGLLGAVATTPEIDGWYAALEKPTWNPPAVVFGPVWTTLYILMGIAAWLVWKEGTRSLAEQKRAKIALRVFVAQLLLNLAWSWIFFHLHQPGWAFLEIVLLWVLVLTTAFYFRSISRLAFWLLVPYAAWVTFASALNFAIWQLN